MNQVSVIFSKESCDSNTTENLIIEEIIGKSNFTVCKVFCTFQNKSYALKVFPKTDDGAQQYEKEKTISAFSHPNIIQNIPITCHSEDFHGLLLEYANYGDFFSLVAEYGVLAKHPMIARSYFHQLIEGLEHLHSKGIAHSDLKLENLVLGSGFTLKIIDFDLAQPITNDKIFSVSGTTNYKAPEVIKGTCKDLKAADIYAAGVILFAFIVRQFPFAEMTIDGITHLKHYSTFLNDNKAFWKKRGDCLDEDYIELVNGMLCKDPEKRFSIETRNGIKGQYWMARILRK